MRKKTIINQKGITLVALVVTIVVLLILAGISISLILGNNGIIKKATDAKTNYSVADNEEQKAMTDASDWMDEKLGIEKTVDINSLPTIPVNTVATEKEHKYVDTTSNKTAIVPQGFKVVTGLDSIDDGLVIEDVSAGDAVTIGSQFVWIPVPNYDNFRLISGFGGSAASSVYIYTAEAGSSLTEAGHPGVPYPVNSVKATPDSYAMYKSVKNYKGFYIARFEAGINGTTQTTDTNSVAQDGTVKPVSKQNVGVWNDITWGGNDSDVSIDGLPGDENANGAAKVSKSMYSTSAVQSTLCYGVQWDAAMNFIDNTYLAQTCATTSFVRNSNGKGNYDSDTLKPTGSSDSYAANHIYDLGGNVMEWTQEAYPSTHSRTCRGGSCFYDTGSDHPASDRQLLTVSNPYKSRGFRVTLYLK